MRILPVFQFLTYFLCCSVLAKPGVVTNETTGKEFATIQQAIDSATEGQTLLVGNGIWKENLSVLTPHHDGLILKSESGPGQCKLSGAGQRIISWAAAGGRIEGFTLTEGAATDKGAVLLANPQDSPELVGNVVSGNHTEGSLLAECIGLISRNVFRENSAHVLLLNTMPGETQVENNVIVGNAFNNADTVAQIFVAHDTLIVRNSTIIDNIIPPNGGVGYFSNARIYNSIFWNNSGRGFHVKPPLVQNCILESAQLNDPPQGAFDLEAPPDYAGNLTSDPMLGPAGQPRPGSPALDAANIENAPVEDILGVSRAADAKATIGAYEEAIAP